MCTSKIEVLDNIDVTHSPRCYPKKYQDTQERAWWWVALLHAIVGGADQEPAATG